MAPNVPNIQYMLYRAAAKIRDLYWKVFRPLTLGSRVIVISSDEILLVKHTYMPGWHLPGGGLKKGETFAEGALRELREECGLIGEDPRLLQIYFSRRQPRCDHIAVYAVDRFSRDSAFKKSREIEELRFFRRDDLPLDLSAGTRRRLAEFTSGKFDTIW